MKGDFKMYIEYWIDNKDSENELHYMSISNTGITIAGITKKDTFRLLKEKLDQFINDFKQLKTVEIGNIQEGLPPYERVPQIIFNDVGCKKNKDFSKWLIEEMKKEGKNNR
jgi:hypothetical protein